MEPSGAKIFNVGEHWCNLDLFVEDNRHVKPAILEAVMSTFERGYCTST